MVVIGRSRFGGREEENSSNGESDGEEDQMETIGKEEGMPLKTTVGRE